MRAAQAVDPDDGAPQRATHPLRPPLPLDVDAAAVPRSVEVVGRPARHRVPPDRTTAQRPSRYRSGISCSPGVIARRRVGRHARGSPAERRRRRARRRARTVADEREDPDALEREADAAERDGDLDRAVRLRFRAGLLRLGDRGAIHYRPSVTTGEVRRTLDSRTVRRARGHVRSSHLRRPRRPTGPTSTSPAANGRTCSKNPGAGEREPSRAGRGAPVDQSPDLDRGRGRRRRPHRRQPRRAGPRPRGRRRPTGRRDGLVVRDRARRARRVQHAADALRPRRRAATRRAPEAPTARQRDGVRARSARGSPTTTRQRFSSSSTNGGRLVIGGRAPFYLRNLRDRPPTWQRDGLDVVDRRSVRCSRTSTTSKRRESDRGRRRGAGRTLVGTDDRSLLTHERVGIGEIFFLADASPLENAYLGTGDNAAFGLALAGDPTARSSSPKAPTATARAAGSPRSRTAGRSRSLLVAVAALAFVWSRARRFGPPDRGRPRPPAGARRVRAGVVDHARTHARPGRRARFPRSGGHARASRRAPGSARTRTTRSSRARRARSGVRARRSLALLAPVSDDASILAFGRAVARVGGDGRNQ